MINFKKDTDRNKVMSKVQATGRATGKPRRKVKPALRSTNLIWVASCVVALLIVGGIGYAWQTGKVSQIAERTKWEVISVTAKLGFQVKEILVTGRERTSREQLLKAIGISQGAPILAFDLNTARERVESLPWVFKATVERQLPGTIMLRIEERRPLAIWQNEGQFSLIDDTGKVILRTGLEKFDDLMTVVGKGAPEHTADLLTALRGRPELLAYVKTAIRVGDRRWDIRMIGNINVKLPESDFADAWHRLAEYEKNHKVLERGVEVLDLRQPDRLIVRISPAKGQEIIKTGRET